MRKLKLPGRDNSQPRLNDADVEHVRERGITGLKDDARQIVEEKLREQPDNDGLQTPLAGNPTYKAMHACHTDSRKRLSQSHRIPAGRELKDSDIDSIVNLLIRWIVREYNFYLEEREKQQRNLSEF